MLSAVSDRPARSRGWLQPAWSLLLAILVLAPTVPAGFVLLRDMVFTPRQPFTPAAFGLGSALPRAVPIDAVMAALTSVLPGMLLQKVALLATLVLAGLGAARLVPTQHGLTRCAAASIYVWNAYVAERLLLGHWSLLIGYATLPWLLRAALSMRAGGWRAAPKVVLLLGVCALTAGGAVLSALVAVPVLAWPGSAAPRRNRSAVGLAAILLNAPWWLPGLLASGASASGAAGVDAFAARAELPIGTLGSLVGLGGVWNAQAVPGSRALFPATIVAVLLPVMAVYGWRRLRAEWGPASSGGAVAAGLGLLLAWTGSVPVLAAGLRWAVTHVPGAGLLRDGQRLVAPLALLLAVAAPLGFERLADRLADPAARSAALVVPVLLPLLVLPDLAWGALGQLQPVAYPDDWQRVRATLAASPPGPGSGDVVALPWQAFRQFGWNAGRTMLDPAPRYLDRTTVVDDVLVVGTEAVVGEDRRAAAVGTALATGRPVPTTLPGLGIGWVLVEKGTPGDFAPGLLAGATLVYSGADLVLYRLGDGTGDGRGVGAGVVADGPWTAGKWASRAVLLADLLAVLLMVGCTVRVLGFPGASAATVEAT